MNEHPPKSHPEAVPETPKGPEETGAKVEAPEVVGVPPETPETKEKIGEAREKLAHNTEEHGEKHDDHKKDAHAGEKHGGHGGHGHDSHHGHGKGPIAKFFEATGNATANRATSVARVIGIGGYGLAATAIGGTITGLLGAPAGFAVATWAGSALVVGGATLGVLSLIGGPLAALKLIDWFTKKFIGGGGGGTPKKAAAGGGDHGHGGGGHH